MIKNIELTRDGDELEATQVAPWNGDYTEKSRLSCCIGTHEGCGGFIGFDELSKYNVLYCRACFLRVPIPSSIKTYGELREWSIKQNSIPSYRG